MPITTSNSSGPSELKELGNKNFHKGEYKLALEYFNAYIINYPNDIEVLILLGQAYRAGCQFNEAKMYFSKAIAHSPKDQVALYGLADVLRHEGKYDDSLRMTKEVLEINKNNGWAHYNLGYLLDIKGDYSKAEQEYRQALEFIKDDYAIYCSLAELLIKKGDLNQGIAVFKQAIPKNNEAIQNIKNTIQELLKEGRIKDAEYIIERFLIYFSKDLDFNKKMADFYLSLRDFKKAAFYYQKLVGNESKDSSLMQKIADIYCYELKNYRSARILYVRVLALEANNLEVIRSLADLCLVINKIPLAIKLYERFIQIKPEDTELLRRLADLCYAHSFLKKAAVFYERLRIQSPSAFDILLRLYDIYRKLDKFLSFSKWRFQRVCVMVRLAVLYRDNKDFNNSERICYEIIKLDKNNIEAWECLSCLYAELNRYDKAMIAYKKIVEIDPRHKKAWLSLGNVYLDLEKHDLALSCYDKVIEIAQDCWEGYLGKGRVLLDARSLLEAEVELKKALSYKPDSVYALQFLADLYRQQNKNDEAVKFYNKCKDIDKNFLASYQGLGELYMAQKQVDKAIEEFNSALKIDPLDPKIKSGVDWAFREKARYELAVESNLKASLTNDELAKIIRPRFCALGIVRRCTFRCKFCQIWKNEDRQELNINQWKDFILSFREIADEHCQINFAGGEPFLKKGLIDVIKLASDKGFTTAACTNAYLINRDIAKQIGMSGLNTIALSLDSLDQKKHDDLRGIKGSYAKVMEAIELLNRHAPRTELNLLTIILKENMVDLLALAEWVQTDKRINIINFLGFIQPRGNSKEKDWFKKPGSNELWPDNADELKRVIDSLIEKKQKGYTKIGNPVSQFLNYKKYYTNPEQFIHEQIKCNLGYLFLSINEKGFVTLCEEREPIGNIVEKDIRDIWFSKVADKIRDEIRDCKQNCHQLINCCYEEEK
ncbi:MAG: tetratricopeptide repeat protein [Candidatus Omnitrophota bacterium]